MYIKAGENYSVSVEASIGGNGIISYDFPSFDRKALELIKSVDSVRAKEKQAFDVVEDGETLVVTLKRFSGEPRVWHLNKKSRAEGFNGLISNNTWEQALANGGIRILSIMYRYFVIDISGSH